MTTGLMPIPPTDGAALTRARRDRLANWLANSDLDAVVCCGAENIQYATGYRSAPGAHRRHQRMAAIVSAEGTTLAGPYAELPAATDAGVDPADYTGYGTFYFDSEHDDPAVERAADLSGALAAALRRAGAIRRLGVDAADCAPASYAVFATELPTATVADVGPGLHDVRAVKLPGEIDRQRTAARLTEAGIDAAVERIAPGVTERELAAVVAATMSAGGALPKFVVVTVGTRAAYSDVFADDTAVRPGDLVRFDVGCVYDGYSSDIGRTAVLGEPTALQARRYAAILAGEQRQLEICRPGLAAADLYRVAIDAVRSGGIPGYRRNHCGHGIGMEGYEGFSVTATSRHILEPGNTLCVETPFYSLGWGGMMVEDTVHVTEHGAELLSGSGRGLRVVA